MKKPAIMAARAAAAACAAALCSCSGVAGGADGMSVASSGFGKTSDGKNVTMYELKNSNGLTVKMIDFGARLAEIRTPDKNGRFENINLNQASLSDYESDNSYFGPVVGRFGNRLGNARFSIDGAEYRLDANENGNTLHGGSRGFDKHVWDSEPVKGDGFVGVKMSRTSPDGEMGFPGNLKVSALFKLHEDDTFSIEYTAETDKPTVCNLTLHPYINLAGAGNGDNLGHLMQIPAESITEVDSELIPTGNFVRVAGTPFDFNKMKPVGRDISDMSHPQMKNGGGYDHNFNLSKPAGEMGLAARVWHPESGRFFEILTEEPCIQFYSGQGQSGKFRGADGKPYGKYCAVVLEPQHAPDNPNHAGFRPSSILRPGQKMTSKTLYRFGVSDGADWGK